jgi:hypothetical protein
MAHRSLNVELPEIFFFFLGVYPCVVLAGIFSAHPTKDKHRHPWVRKFLTPPGFEPEPSRSVLYETPTLPTSLHGSLVTRNQKKNHQINKIIKNDWKLNVLTVLIIRLLVVFKDNFIWKHYNLRNKNTLDFFII